MKFIRYNRRRCLATLLVSIVVSIALSACDQKQAVVAPSADSQQNSAEGTAVVPKPPVDGASLQVYKISVATMQRQGLYLGSASYDVDGNADYVKIRACGINAADQTECIENKTALNRLEIPPFPGGSVTVTVSACVEANRSTSGTPCGPPKQYNYTQASNANSKAAQLVRARALKVEELKNFGKELKGIFERYLRDIEKCTFDAEKKEKAEARKEMVAGYVALGESIISSSIAIYEQECANIRGDTGQAGPVESQLPAIGLAGEEVAGADQGFFQKILSSCTGGGGGGGGGQASQPVGGGQIPDQNDLLDKAKDVAGDWIKENIFGSSKTKSLEPEGATPVSSADLSEVAKNTQKSAGKLENFSEYANVVTGAFQSVGLFKSQPVSAIQALGTAVFDLMSGDDTITAKCTAEQRSQSETTVLKQRLNAVRRQIADIDTRIKLGGGGFELP